MIKAAAIQDLKEIAPYGKAFYEEGNLVGNYDPETFVKNWTVFLEKGLGVIFIMESMGKFAGALGGILFMDPNNNDVSATELFWYVLPEHRNGIEPVRLLLAFEHWAKEMGARRVSMMHTFGTQVEQLSGIYTRLGYRPLEVHYVKEI